MSHMHICTDPGDCAGLVLSRAGVVTEAPPDFTGPFQIVRDVAELITGDPDAQPHPCSYGCPDRIAHAEGAHDV